MIYVATLQHKNPYTVGHVIYKSSTPFLGHNHYILSVISAWKQKSFYKKILAMHVHQYYMIDMATSQHRKPCFKGIEMYNSSRPSLFSTTFILCEPFIGVEKKGFSEIHHFFTFLCPKLPPDPLEMGSNENYNFLSPNPKDATYQIW